MPMPSTANVTDPFELVAIRASDHIRHDLSDKISDFEHIVIRGTIMSYLVQLRRELGLEQPG
jgi:hypothetical protein